MTAMAPHQIFLQQQSKLFPRVRMVLAIQISELLSKKACCTSPFSFSKLKILQLKNTLPRLKRTRVRRKMEISYGGWNIPRGNADFGVAENWNLYDLYDWMESKTESVLGWLSRFSGKIKRLWDGEEVHPLKYLRLFGFFEGRYSIFFFLMFILFLLLVFAGLIGFADLGFGGDDRLAILFNVLFPLSCLAVPPCVFLLSLIGGLLNFLRLDSGQDLGLSDESWLVGLVGFGVSSILVLSELLAIMFIGDKFLWGSIRFVLWSYFIIMYSVTFAVVILGVKICGNQIKNLDELLNKVTDGENVLRSDRGFSKHKIHEVRQVNRMVASLSRRISPYMCSQLVVLTVTIVTTIGLLYRIRYLSQKDKAMGAPHFVILSFLQTIFVWWQLRSFRHLNIQVRSLATTAGNVSIDAETKEEYNADRVNALVAVANYVEKHTEKVSIYGWEIDPSLLQVIGATHLTFVACIGGPLVSSIQAPPDETTQQLSLCIKVIYRLSFVLYEVFAKLLP